MHVPVGCPLQSLPLWVLWGLAGCSGQGGQKVSLFHSEIKQGAHSLRGNGTNTVGSIPVPCLPIPPSTPRAPQDTWVWVASLGYHLDTWFILFFSRAKGG